MNDTRVSMELDTDFPRSGHVRVRTGAENGASFSLALRIPEYAENFELLVNGARTSGKIEKGFLYLNALSGDTELEIDFAMSPHFVRADPRVRADIGKIAIVRGPEVYLSLIHIFSDRSIINLIHAVGGHLGDEHLRDEGQALVERRVHAGNN